jgi:DNA-nicking Smr family endonuclease
MVHAPRSRPAARCFLTSLAFVAIAMTSVRELSCVNTQKVLSRLERRRLSPFGRVDTTRIARMVAHVPMRIWIDRAPHSGVTCALVLHPPQGER